MGAVFNGPHGGRQCSRRLEVGQRGVWMGSSRIPSWCLVGQLDEVLVIALGFSKPIFWGRGGLHLRLHSDAQVNESIKYRVYSGIYCKDAS